MLSYQKKDSCKTFLWKLVKLAYWSQFSFFRVDTELNHLTLSDLGFQGIINLWSQKSQPFHSARGREGHFLLPPSDREGSLQKLDLEESQIF